MAVARPEFTVGDFDWLVQLVQENPPPRQYRSVLKELRREQERVHGVQKREMAVLRKRRAALPTAP